MAETYKLTPQGLFKLRKQAEELESRLRELDSQVSEAAETGGNQWHDNFSYEQLTQQIRGVNHRLSEVHRIIRQGVLADKPSGQKIEVGTKVKLKIDQEEEEWTIGGYGESDPDQNIIAYNTPLAMLVLGKVVGEKVIGVLGKKSVQLEILEINLEGQ